MKPSNVSPVNAGAGTKNPLFRHGALSTLITVLVLAFIVLLNAALTALFAKRPLNIDLTQNKIFELSKETKGFLEALKTDAEVYVLNAETAFAGSNPSQYFTQANEVVKKYAQLSPQHVRLSYVDLLRNPDFASRYPGLNLRVNDILVVSGDKSRVLSPQDLFNVRSSYYGSYIESSKAEQSLTRALASICGEKAALVLVLFGHNEEDVAAFTELLSLNNYESVRQNLLTEDITAEASVAILAAPARDLTAEELRKLDAFLASGDHKTLFYLASAAQGDMPNLADFLAEWGISVEGGVVFERDSARLLSNSPFIALAEYAETEFSKTAASRALSPVIFSARPLKPLFESSGSKTVTALLRASATSGVRPANAASDWQPAAADTAPNTPVLTLSRSVRNGADGSPLRANVLVSGSAHVLGQNILSSRSFANSTYFLDVFARLSGREQLFSIEDKTLGASELGATLNQVMLIAAVFAGLLPLSLLVVGTVVWFRRRHL
jgi:ABC-type uncharacterized transport system involved in gliding motility auxiliary subunit